MPADNIDLIILNPDQQREGINTRQRFEAFRDAATRAKAFRGSMGFSSTNGSDYLLRSYYGADGKRRQRSLGRRSEETVRILAEFENGRSEAKQRLSAARDLLDRQAGINNALGLGRVPEIGARIIRALDSAELLGQGLRVVGTNALFAYEAAAGIALPSDVTTTEDIDILFDARRSLRFALSDDVEERSLISLLKRVDRSFERTHARYQARNKDGYLVDLISPVRNPPWQGARTATTDDDADLEPVEIEGLVWHENARPFEAVAIDAKGYPVRIVAPDPRDFVVHKLWLSKRDDRHPAKRGRDVLQARVVAKLVSGHLRHLNFNPRDFRNFPLSLVEAATPLFVHPESIESFNW